MGLIILHIKVDGQPQADKNTRQNIGCMTLESKKYFHIAIQPKMTVHKGQAWAYGPQPTA